MHPISQIFTLLYNNSDVGMEKSLVHSFIPLIIVESEVSSNSILPPLRPLT